MSQLKIETVAVGSLVLDPANVRLHDAKNLEAIKGSLARFGQQKPIVVDAKGVVLAGNGTLTAARALGWKTITVARTSLTGSEAVAFALADNRTSDLSTWDLPALGDITAGLTGEGFDVGAIGFDAAFLASLPTLGAPAAQGDPWGTAPEEGPEVEVIAPEDQGRVNRILLVYGPAEYEHVLALTEGALAALECKNMSQLFVKLLEGAA